MSEIKSMTIVKRSPLDEPIKADVFAELMKQRMLHLNKDFYVGQKMMDAFFQYGATYNDIVNANQKDSQTKRYIVPASTGSGKTVSAKLYLSEIAKLGYAGLLVVSEVETAINTAEEINDLAGSNVAGTYYSISDKHEETDVRYKIEDLPRIAIITHALFIQRSDSGKDIELLRNYGGKQRDCIIIDERIDLIKRVSFGTRELPDLIAILRRDEELNEIALALENFNDIIFKTQSNASAKYQDDFRKVHQSFRMHLLEVLQELRYGKYNLRLKMRSKKSDSDNLRKDVIGLLDRIAYIIDSRFSHTGEGKNIIIHREEDLSSKFGSVAILDATADVNPLYEFSSANAKDLTRMSRSDVRTYGNVDLHLCAAKSFNQSKTGLYVEPKRDGKLVEVVDAYLRIISDTLFMSNDKMLVVTYKDLVPLFRERSPYPNVTFIHWGSAEARGSNEFSDYNKAMVIGWFRRPKHFYVGSVLSITDLDTYQSTTGSIISDANKLEQMLIIDDMVQFFNRTRSRVAIDEDGNCDVVDLYVFTGGRKSMEEIIKDTLTAEMKGINFKSWKPSDIAIRKKKTKVIERIDNIIEWMLSKRGEYDELAFSTILQQFGLDRSKMNKVIKHSYFTDLCEEEDIVKFKEGRNVLFKLPEPVTFEKLLNTPDKMEFEL